MNKTIYNINDKQHDKLFFAPQLLVNNGTKDIFFYSKAFGATENLCFYNDDGSIYVAELSIEGIIFHVHEVTNRTFFLLLAATL